MDTNHITGHKVVCILEILIVLDVCISKIVDLKSPNKFSPSHLTLIGHKPRGDQVFRLD